MAHQNSVVGSILGSGLKKISAAPEHSFCPPQGECSIKVTLDELRPYELNPRQSINPLYEDIKACIRIKGLDFPPNITVRPGADHYIIRDGGNTRLAILRDLYEETGDNQFFQITCKFRPWVDELDTFASHIVENELRAPMLFAERAMAAKQMESLILKKSGAESISLRELAKKITANGWVMNFSALSVLMYVAESLIAHIPEALWAGMGRPAAKSIRKLESSAKTYCASEGIEHDQFMQLWQIALNESDSANLQLSDLRENLFIRVRDALGKDSIGIVEAEIDAVINGIILPADSQDEPGTPMRVPSSQMSPSSQNQKKPEVFEPGPSDETATSSPGNALENQPPIPQLQKQEIANQENDLTPSSNSPFTMAQKIFTEFEIENFLIEDDSEIGFGLDISSFSVIPDSQKNQLQAGILAIISQFLHARNYGTNANSINQALCDHLFAGDWATFTEILYQIFILFRLDPEISRQSAFLALRGLEEYFCNNCNNHEGAIDRGF